MINLKFKLTPTGVKIWNDMLSQYSQFVVRIGNNMDSLTVLTPDNLVINYTNLLVQND